MIYFKNDYSEGCLPQVLEALTRTNLESTCGYGLDPYCAQAAEKLRARFACPEAAVHFLVGGTQANFTVISALLRPWEAVIAADTAHIAVHETGAVEARGHKVFVTPGRDGKLTAEAVRRVMAEHHNGADEHMVLPRLVYISNATELGTVYTRAELEALSAACRELGLLLYLDGARLGAALSAEGCDLTPEDLPRLCDAFTLGGTKNGLLFGEALVLSDPALQPHFRHAIKQNGGMLAKGRLLGVQFSTLLQDDLWLRAAKHANIQAQRLASGLRAARYRLAPPTPTNQVFAVLPRALHAALRDRFEFDAFAPVDETHEIYRLVASWATPPEWVDAFLAALPPAEDAR